MANDSKFEEDELVIQDRNYVTRICVCVYLNMNLLESVFFNP